MKMDSTFSAPIFCCLALTVVRSFGELVVLHHPPSIDTPNKLTCISEDGNGAALIWNYNPRSPSAGIEDFTPKRPESGKVDDCAVRNASNCLAGWDTTNNWNVESSAQKPMGPVLDHRWEGFPQFNLRGPIKDQVYQHVVEVKSTGSMWFSARGKHDLYVYMCENIDPSAGPCIWLLIAGWWGEKSVIKYCANGTDEPRGPEKSCQPISDYVQHKRNKIIDSYEWRTFKIEWNSEDKAIKIFKSNVSKPFLKGTILEWPEKYYVSVRGDFPGRIRFHFYNYYFTETNNTAITTKNFAHSGEKLHAELLVSICPKCKLSVRLVDKGHHNIGTWIASAVKLNFYSDLLTWQSIQLITTLESDGLRDLKFEIKTILDANTGTGRWAIDNFRIYESGDQTRRSDITLERENDEVSCQKLSYTGVDKFLKNSLPRLEILSHEVKVGLREFSRRQNESDIGQNGFICNANGCVCGRGFTGINCSKICDKGFHGYDCEEKCGSCLDSINCNAITGFCPGACEGHKITPLCQIAPSNLEKTSDSATHLAWLAIPLVLAVCLLVLFIRHRKRKAVCEQPNELTMSCRGVLPLCPDYSTDFSEVLTPQPNEVHDQLAIDPAHAVPIQVFEKYIKQSAAGGVLDSQFMSLPVGLTRACEYGSLPENLQKNRSENLIAYDETRVILQRVPSDPHSDYINASYIKGYEKERAYIATQGPMAHTVNDFWRMIWQEDVRVICMLTNLVEGSTTLCEQYWPEAWNESQYGDILISNTHQQIFADYTFRTFKLSKKQRTQKVAHLHYTGWPSSGVPMYPQSLVTYLDKLRRTTIGNGPVVVHCHTGDDRTGTIILTDICLRQADAKRVIDATAAITRMRKDRANMVGTLQQYLFAHILIAESLVSQPTQIPCDEKMSRRIEKMKKQLEFDIKRLNDTMWQERALQYFAALNPQTTGDLVGIFPAMENAETLIGAVSVDGVRVKGQYLAAWLPTPLSLHEFWNFVVEKNAKLIIILQCSDPRNPSCCDIIPDEPTLLHMPHMEVQSEANPNGDEHFKTEKILLAETSEDDARRQSVTVITCKGWGSGENGKPPNTETLVSLWEASEKIPRMEGETLVLCHDGVTGCGLYLALSFMLERMAVERECDVFSAVRAVRRSRPQFVKTSEEFDYLYNAAVTYAECFATYSNFT